MSPVLLFLLLLLLGAADLRRLHQTGPGGPPGGLEEPRVPRGAKDRDPDGFFTTPRVEPLTRPGNGSGVGDARLLAPGGSYLAYGVMLVALLLFAAGVVGNLALMCIVWHNVYLKSAWNCILAGVAFWDFLVLFFCLPVVVFHELTASRLLGDASCRLVPYLEVTSLGVATFSLCALSIDRFHAATGPGALQVPRVEPCRSILSKLSVIWTGSMVLAAPELLLWQLVQDTVSMTALPTVLQPAASLMASFTRRTDVFVMDVCVRQPSEDLPENIYALVLTYHEARMWWFFGCYLCLPLLFTLACDLVTRQVLAQRVPQSPNSSKVSRRRAPSATSLSMKKKRHVREQCLRTTVVALTVVYVTCNLPENICNIALAYISLPSLPDLVLPVVVLVGEFLRFARCAATPVLLLCLCRSLGQAFMDCCCCCCEECLPDTNSSSASTAATSTSPSTLSSPTSSSPVSLLPCPKEDRVKSESALSCGKQSSGAIGTPC